MLRRRLVVVALFAMAAFCGCSANEYWVYKMSYSVFTPETRKHRVSFAGDAFAFVFIAAVETLLLPVTVVHDLILYSLRQGEEGPRDSGEEPFPSPLSLEAPKERGPPGWKRAVIQSRTWRAARVDNAIFSSRVLDQRDRIAPQRP